MGCCELRARPTFPSITCSVVVRADVRRELQADFQIDVKVTFDHVPISSRLSRTTGSSSKPYDRCPRGDHDRAAREELRYGDLVTADSGHRRCLDGVHAMCRTVGTDAYSGPSWKIRARSCELRGVFRCRIDLIDGSRLARRRFSGHVRSAFGCCDGPSSLDPSIVM